MRFNSKMKEMILKIYCAINVMKQAIILKIVRINKKYIKIKLNAINV